MDCKTVLLLCIFGVLALVVTETYGRSKKVVIHVPYKVRKVKHTHTVYKTVHHHHTHHDPHLDHSSAPTEEHEHFHHMHIHNEPPSGQHSQPVPDIGIPEFLPDALNAPLEIPDIPRAFPKLPSRLALPLYRRN
ncbi:putative uncharacterized protein DDB_G0287191 [Manduca sexta]|uniref:putative uncharacterized protein DDB_G0287191 n=1 Tax=Manduca sexta TaxID=7130 RepID=UPI00188F43C1|nr:putative uncharacterized protein DDB_G0287191 [Manduca sexta]